MTCYYDTPGVYPVYQETTPRINPRSTHAVIELNDNTVILRGSILIDNPAARGIL